LEVSRALDRQLIGSLRVKAIELPVVYGRATRRITDAIARIRPTPS